MSLSRSSTTKKLQLNAGWDQCNSGTIKIYSGTRPTDADTALAGNTLLATLTFGATAFAAATNSGNTASKTANAITADNNAAATGTASFFRSFKSDGTTVVGDGSIGTSGADLNLNSTSIVAGTTVTATSMAVTAGA